MDGLLWLFVIAFIVVFVALVFLWRRGAIDKTKAKQEADDAWLHIQKDVRSWRDKLKD